MGRRRSSPFTPIALWTDAMLSGVATAVTLSARLSQIATGTMTAAEAKRMVREKVDAARDGVAAGTDAAARIGFRRLARPAPHLLLADAAAVVEAASRPARRRVKGNAKRLSKR